MAALLKKQILKKLARYTSNHTLYYRKVLNDGFTDLDSQSL